MNRNILKHLNSFVNITKEYKVHNSIMKKLLFNKNDLKIFGIALRKMQPDTRFSQTFSLGESCDYLNKNLSMDQQNTVKVTPHTIKNWILEGVLRSEIVKKDEKDSIGRDTIEYKVVKDDIENLSLFLGSEPLLVSLGLIGKRSHPETNADIIYFPANQNKQGLSTASVELIAIGKALIKKDVFRILEEAIKEAENKPTSK